MERYFHDAKVDINTEKFGERLHWKTNYGNYTLSEWIDYMVDIFKGLIIRGYKHDLLAVSFFDNIFLLFFVNFFSISFFFIGSKLEFWL